MGLLKSLVIPTNPDYKWELDPDEQPEYVNPVALNNREVQYANAAIRVAQRLVATNRHIAKSKQNLATARHALEDFERELLLAYPAPSSATKSTKLLQAYLYAAAIQHDKRETLNALVTEVRAIERDLISLEIEADMAHTAFQAIKLGGEHIQTHLSFVKNERAASGKYV